MTDRLPKYDSPPVVETVLSVQFAPLQHFSSAHAGWFWKNYLDKEWGTVHVAPRLDDQFERFGDEMLWGRGAGLRIATQPEPDRLQIIRSDNERMIQIQDTRFIYNWKKQEGSYPSYDKLLPEFLQAFSSFKKFTSDAGNGPLKLNQWEVTYVNLLPRGELWQTINDWQEIFPALSKPVTTVDNLFPEDFRVEWRLAIGNNLGRLFITINRGKIGSEKGGEVILLQFTARGPLKDENESSLQSGFDLGHQSIVLSFTDTTSDAAHKFWERRA